MYRCLRATLTGRDLVSARVLGHSGWAPGGPPEGSGKLARKCGESALNKNH